MVMMMESGSGQLSKDVGVVVVVDYGSQYTQLIARRAREIGLQSVIVNGGGGNAAVAAELEDVLRGRAGGEGGACVVLSGGPNSVHADGAPGIDVGVLESLTGEGVPVLGICYGMQLLVSTYGGQVVRGGTGRASRTGARAYAGTRAPARGADAPPQFPAQTARSTGAWTSAWPRRRAARAAAACSTPSWARATAR